MLLLVVVALLLLLPPLLLAVALPLLPLLLLPSRALIRGELSAHAGRTAWWSWCGRAAAQEGACWMGQERRGAHISRCNGRRRSRATSRTRRRT